MRLPLARLATSWPPRGGGLEPTPCRVGSAVTSAAAAARAEAEVWAGLVGAGLPEATEADVVRFHDPGPDLDRRAAAWGHGFAGYQLAALARFAAALALAEADAWDADEPHVATRAYEDRRFLLGDRIAHWAVPWLDAIGAAGERDALLALGDRLRPAPLLTSTEGIVPPGHDEYGPLPDDVPLDDLLGSVWSGLVQLGRPLPDPARYDGAAARWEGLATAHPGTAALWAALAGRAAATARRLRATPPRPSRSAP